MSINIDKKTLQKNLGKFENYFTDDAWGQTEIIHQRAVYYNDKIYIVYQKSAATTLGPLDPYILYYDLSDQYWSDPVNIGTNPLTQDSHGTPAVIIDALGYIHVFFGSHADAGTPKHYRSTNPADISAWTAQTNMPVTYCTYPNVVKLSNGNIYYFYRGGSITSATEWYVVSTDNGTTWGAETEIIDFGAGYSIYMGKIVVDANNKIWMIWTKNVEAGNTREDIYCAYLNTDGKMYSPNGTDLGATISLSEADTYCKVWESSGAENSLGTIAVSTDNYPRVLWLNKTTKRQYFSRWTGSAWVSPVMIVNTDSGAPYGEAGLILNSTSSYECYMCVASPFTKYGTVGGDLCKFVSTDSGANWRLEKVILAASENDGVNLNQANVVYDYQSNFKIVITSQVYETLFGVSNWQMKNKLYAYGNNGLIYRRYYW